MLPTVLELKHLSAPTFFEIVLAIVICMPAVLSGYALGASRARRCLRRPRTVQWIPARDRGRHGHRGGRGGNVVARGWGETIASMT